MAQHLGQIALYPELQNEEQFVLLHVYEKAALTCGVAPNFNKLLPRRQALSGAPKFDRRPTLSMCMLLCMRCCCSGSAWQPVSGSSQHVSWPFCPIMCLMRQQVAAAVTSDSDTDGDLPTSSEQNNEEEGEYTDEESDTPEDCVDEYPPEFQGKTAAIQNHAKQPPHATSG